MVALVTHLDIRYIAGLFDGEGCIFVGRRELERMKGISYRLTLKVSMTVERPIKALKDTLGGSYGPIHWHTRNNNRTAWRWEIDGNKAAEVLKQVLPYLLVKKEEAVLAIQFQEHLQYLRNKLRHLPEHEQVAVMAYRQAMYEAIRALKKASGALDDKVVNSVDTQLGESQKGNTEPSKVVNFG